MLTSYSHLFLDFVNLKVSLSLLSNKLLMLAHCGAHRYSFPHAKISTYITRTTSNKRKRMVDYTNKSENPEKKYKYTCKKNDLTKLITRISFEKLLKR